MGGWGWMWGIEEILTQALLHEQEHPHGGRHYHQHWPQHHHRRQDP